VSLASALNCGILQALQAGLDRVLVVNDDVVFTPDGVEALLVHLDLGRLCACPVLPEMVRLYPDFRHRFPAEAVEPLGSSPRIGSDLSDLLEAFHDFYAPAGGLPGLVTAMGRANRGECYGPYFQGAAFLGRPELFEQVGLFDTRFTPAYHQDIDYSRRIGALGADSVLCFDSFFHHWGGATMRHQEGLEAVFRRHQELLDAKEAAGCYRIKSLPPPPGDGPGPPLQNRAKVTGDKDTTTSSEGGMLPSECSGDSTNGAEASSPDEALGENDGQQNPWLPWIEPLRLRPDNNGVGILAIIPTAGHDATRLTRCLQSIREARGEELLRVVLVLCPTSAAVLRAIGPVAAQFEAELITLEGPFSYPRSLNAGLARRRADEHFTLLMNDDAAFTSPAGLERLVQTLRDNRWCAVGPWIDGWHNLDAGRTSGCLRTNQPILGACVLWDSRWLERIGPFDERFGLGYGVDESDHHLRALRLGALWGREDRVECYHERAGSFGCDHHEAHCQNLRTFALKYGLDVDVWGRSAHWEPLPGIHVAIAGHNVAPYIERALTSVEAALDGFRWILTFADDASTDDTYDRVKAHRSGADLFSVKCFGKARNAAEAKNRAIALGQPFHARYPALVLMDADDEMTEDRIRFTLARTRDSGALVSYGDFEQVYCDLPADQRFRVPSDEMLLTGGISPCTSIIHRSLVPPGGELFSTTMDAMEDTELFLRWHLRNVPFIQISGAILHRYHWRDGSVMRSEGTGAAIQAWSLRRAELLKGTGIILQ
jgi:GT2 family glycosyltransferase